MKHLIDKDALVAEIKRMIKNSELYIEHHRDNNDRLRYSFEHQRLAMCELLSFIDNLEVKGVDNVWHDASETPKGAGDKEILVQFSDFHTSVLEIDDWKYLDHQTKWAYLKDLI